jgi:hypothetical protein
VSASIPRNRASRSLLTAIALAGLAALAPSPATAQDDAPALGICMPSGEAPGEMDFNGYEFCAVDQAAGGGGGGSAPSAPGGNPSTAGHEVVRVKGVIPYCLKDPNRCMPDRRGDRGLDINEGDGPSRSEPRGGKRSAGTGKKSETAKEPGKPTKEECERYWKDAKAGEPMPQFKDRWDRLHAQWDKLNLWTRGRDEILEAFRVGQIVPLVQDIEKLRAQRSPVLNSAKLLALEASHREAKYMYDKLLDEGRREYAARLKALREAQNRLMDEEAAILHPLLLSCKVRKLI